MERISGASNTQKTVILALAEGWRLRHVDAYGWCLFQASRERPFANLRSRTIVAMTDAGWLTADSATLGLGLRPAKELTPLGEAYARKLIDAGWAESRWEPPEPAIEEEPTGHLRLRRAA